MVIFAQLLFVIVMAITLLGSIAEMGRNREGSLNMVIAFLGAAACFTVLTLLGPYIH